MMKKLLEKISIKLISFSAIVSVTVTIAITIIINININSNNTTIIEQQIIKNNNYGLSEETINKLVRFYLGQNKSISEIKQAIKNYEQLKQDFIQLTGDSPEVKKTMDKAQKHIDNLQFDDAIIAINYALSLESQDIIAKSDDNHRKIIINRAKKHAIIGNTYRQKFSYQQARDSYIEAYKTITDNLSHNQFNNDIRQIQSKYLHHITYNSFYAGLYDDEITNRYTQLAVSFAKEYFGDDHAQTLTSLNNLAELYREQGFYDKAEPLYIEVLKKRTKILGRNHLNSLISINNLAGLYYEQARYDKAEPLYIEALDLKTKTLGRDHPSTLISINNLAKLYHKQGRYDKAEKLYIEALDLKTKTLGRDHPSTLISINNLAELYDEQKRYKKAEALYKEALAGFKKIFPNGHTRIEATENNLENLKEKMGKEE